MGFFDDVFDVITTPFTAPVKVVSSIISGGNVIDSVSGGIKSVVIAPFKPIQNIAPQGTFFNTAVGHISNSIGNAAINPLTLTQDIASGKNVGNSLGNFVARDQAAIFAPSNVVLGNVPIVNNAIKKIPLLGGAIAQNEQYQYQAGEGTGHLSDSQLFAAGRDQLEVGATVVGAIFGAPALGSALGVSTGTVITTGTGVGSALAKGNYAGALGAAAGGVGGELGGSDNPFVSAGGDLLGNVGDKLGETPTRAPVGRSPAGNIGGGSASVVYPLPSATPDTSGSGGSSLVSPVLLVAGAVGLALLARRRL